MSRAQHWDNVYGRRAEDRLTWYEERPALSLELIGKYAGPHGAVIDVGGGASRLVDHLAQAGGRDLAVLDLSEAALKLARARLGEAAQKVDWITADVTHWQPARRYALWHDRAVFHFLTDPAERAGYLRAAMAALDPGGHAIIATFALDGPEKCSNLPVVRYAPATLAAEVERLAPGAFTPVEARAHMHVSPAGARQSFQVSVLRRTGAAAGQG